MKKLVEDVKDEGLTALFGQRVTLYCMNYIYTGKLIGADEVCCLLHDAGIVYETGPHADKTWTDMQPLPGPWYVMLKNIESFGVMK